MCKSVVPGVLFFFGGCVAPKAYRPVQVLTPAVVERGPDATFRESIAKDALTALPVSRLCAAAKSPQGHLTEAGGYGGSPESGPCLAFVEYDKAGKPYRDTNRRVGDQMEVALDLVRKAIADDPQHQPIVVAFVHGWKHSDNPGNAAAGAVSRRPPEDENVQGFEHVLNFLYRCYYADPANTPCVKQTRNGVGKSMPLKGHVVVGIYFSWYGANISPAFPVAQQISVYSRGTEADRVASAMSFSHDLERLSVVAHPTAKPEGKEPLLILVGHSFGARLLEQSIERPMKDRIAQQIAPGANGKVPNFADLVLYVNEAAAAEKGVGMLDFLGKNEVEYRTTEGPRVGPEPLIASVTTPADAATGVAFSVAYYPKSLSQTGNVTLTAFAAGAPGKHTFSISEPKRKLYRNTLGHLTEFQSHVLAEVTPPNCEGGDPDDFYFRVPEHCFHVSEAKPFAGQDHRWNGTPYWVISTDQNVIPDHGTIFTSRFMRFVGHLLPDERYKPIVTGVLTSGTARF